MAFVHGKNSVIKVDNASGVLTDISLVTNAVDLPRSVETADTSHFGTSAKEYIVGLNDGTVSISGLYDPAVDATLSAAFDAIIGGSLASATVEYSPAGLPVSATKPKFTLEVIWTAYSTAGGVGDPISFKLEGQRTGPTVRTVA
ncbi:hypothetical protein [Mycetocola sp.]|uniref:hypothetical protein n=1 Tax=Mycetocola sp. TaxID=1871042 RepID=UPI003989FE04